MKIVQRLTNSVLRNENCLLSFSPVLRKIFLFEYPTCWRRIMHRFTATCLSVTLLAANLAAGATFAQETQSPATFSQEDGLRIVKEVRKRLQALTNYGVFDWLTFGIHGNNIVLNGYASRPTLKSDAERSVKSIPGVAGVDNDIDVLPPSPMDDRIRAAVYDRLYTNSVLSKYNANRGSLARAMGPGSSIAARAGGITQNPPIGFHAIHIIVRNGNVMLFGVVNNQSDADIANIQANSTPGAFSVENYLEFPGQAPEAAR
jgi:hyperosmotically inducible periplasmic protein